MDEITLYTKDVTGSIRVWSISSEADTIIIEFGQLGGSIQTKYETIDEGKQSRTIEEQVEHRINSRVMKQIDKGYGHNLSEIREKPVTNALGFLKPMLAHPIKNRHISFPCYIQRKYDGHRCLIRKDGEDIVAYSRNGKPITTIKHITDEILKMDTFDSGTIDGELYVHGLSLQKISSLVKRNQAESSGIKLMVYDVIHDDENYNSRFAWLSRQSWPKSVEIAETKIVYDDYEINGHFVESREGGYEGSIVRHGDTGYEHGKRSYSLLKVKGCHDTECMVINIEPSKDGWARLECQYKGKTFWVSAPGTMDEKYKAMVNADKLLGEYVKIEYANLTKDGVPFHPIATAWFNDISL